MKAFDKVVDELIHEFSNGTIRINTSDSCYYDVRDQWINDEGEQEFNEELLWEFDLTFNGDYIIHCSSYFGYDVEWKNRTK